MEDVRRKLLDLTRANRLLNHKANGARTLAIIDEIPKEVYRIIVKDEKAMQFLSREEAPESVALELARRDSGTENSEEHSWELAPLDNDGNSSRYTDRKLQTSLAGEKLQTRLLAIARDAKAALDEQGCNTLYLTLGMIEWRAAGEQELVNRAPLVFVPVQLDRKNANSRHFVTAYDDEVITNPCLAELARQDFAFSLSAFESDGGESLDEYFAQIDREVSMVKGWKFSREIHLGLFSFAKLLMWRDLDDKRWPAQRKISDHALIKVLRGLGGEKIEGGNGTLAAHELDNQVKPVDCFHVMDSDSSQHAAIHAVKNGANLVIEGPPGTGKSQTITNIIAEFIAADKTVLFVAEKSAALDVVKRRLEAAALGDGVIALHSKNTKKREIMGELRRVLDLQESLLPVGTDKAETLSRVRDRLRAYHEEVHRRLGGLGISIFGAVGQALNLSGESEIPCPIPDVLKWDAPRLAAVKEVFETIDRRLLKVGARGAHPWRASRLTKFGLDVRQSLRQQGEAVVSVIESIRRESARLAALMGAAAAPVRVKECEGILQLAGCLINAPRAATGTWTRFSAQRRSEIVAWVGSIKRYEQEKAMWSGTLKGSAEEEEWDQWLSRRERGGGLVRFVSWQWHKDTRQFRHHLLRPSRPARSEEVRLVRAVITSVRTKRNVACVGDSFSELLGGAWKGLGGNCVDVVKAVRAVLDLWEIVSVGAVNVNVAEKLVAGDRAELSALSDGLIKELEHFKLVWAEFLRLSDSNDAGWHVGGSRSCSFVEFRDRILGAISGLDSLEDWTDLNAAVANGAAGPGAKFVEWGLGPNGIPGRLAGGFARQFYRCWIDAALEKLAAVREWRGEDYFELARRFKELDRDWIQATRHRIRELLASRRPNVGGRTARQSELGVLKAELRKKQRFMPLRKLFSAAGETIQAIKPCFMMSPISVAQYLAPGALEFDLVIFDEASQVEPADAFGAIGRGRQLVLVGDEKQLPPTNFFGRLDGEQSTDDDGDSVTDMESILSLGGARFRHRSGLRWHYRSRHASLIEFSNEKFYDGELRIFASPHTDRTEMGLGFRFVEGGIYKRGTGRFNQIEAQAVARAVIDHAESKPGISLGVGALNLPQANAILDELETLRRDTKNSNLESFFDDKRPEPFFVKNLERIQGDEREVMFLSVGYGYDSAGRMPPSFGAINGDGGWRRLNVFATRARQRCLIFSSIRAEDIKIGTSAPRGVVAFKEYLYAAEHGMLAESPVPQGDHDSPFEADVCKALRDRGWEVHSQIGSAGFSIDLAIVHPKRAGRYLLGIECDGETYHRGATARDRDRLRQEVLEGLGWEIYRIWSSDWFRRRGDCLGRLILRIEELASRG